MLSQGDDTGDKDVLTLLKQEIKEKYNKPGNVYLGLVHRLDRPTGGIMVFARTSKAASRLSEQIRNRTFEKTYLAVVRGVVYPLNGTFKDFLLKDNSRNIVKTVDPEQDGKEAILNYHTIGNVNNLTLLEIKLVTGRSHQIRVQFATRGFPLLGDGKYGENSENRDDISLWSYRVKFKHPTRDEIMEFRLHPPKKYPWDIFPRFEK